MLPGFGEPWHVTDVITPLKRTVASCSILERTVAAAAAEAVAAITARGISRSTRKQPQQRKMPYGGEKRQKCFRLHESEVEEWKLAHGAACFYRIYRVTTPKNRAANARFVVVFYMILHEIFHNHYMTQNL